MGRVGMCGANINGPKRHQTRRLGPQVRVFVNTNVFFYFFITITVTTTACAPPHLPRSQMRAGGEVFSHTIPCHSICHHCHKVTTSPSFIRYHHLRHPSPAHPSITSTSNATQNTQINCRNAQGPRSGPSIPSQNQKKGDIDC